MTGYDTATFYELIERSIKNHFPECGIINTLCALTEMYWHHVYIDEAGRDNVEAEMGAINDLNKQLLVFRPPEVAAIRLLDSFDMKARHGFQEAGGRNWTTTIRISLGYKS